MILGILVKLALGVLLGGVIGAIVTGDYLYTIVYAVAIPVVILLAVFGGRRSRRLPGGDGVGYARVEHVKRVGSEPDGRQTVDVRLTVVGPLTYATTTRTALDEADLRTIVAGAIVPVLLTSANRPDAYLVVKRPAAPDIEARMATVTGADIPPASQVPAWETATTTTPGTPKPGTPMRLGAVLNRVLAIAIILAVAAAVLIPAYPSIARGVNNIATGNWDGSDMVTGLYLQESVDQMADAAGTSMFTDLAFYPTYILGEAESRDHPGRADAVEWRYGRAWVDGPAFIQPSDLEAEVFDVSELDFSIVSRVANEAVAIAGIENPESVYASVRRSGFDDNAVQFHVSITGEYDDAYFTYDTEGRELDRSGSLFD